MCGIAGIISKNYKIDQELLGVMTDSLAHRGPDGRGIWMNEKKTVGFGQRRLAIIDVSDGGRQPRVSPDGKVAVTFNGEIYNYLDLKSKLQLKGWEFKSNSDTEVLLLSYLEWGKECLKYLNGMFAFAIWDGRTEELFAARDRIGERPFKYYFNSEKFVFASEVKSLLNDKTIPRILDNQAVDLALSFRFVPAPATGFVGIYKLPAGHYLTWKGGSVTVRPYWNISEVAQRPAADYEPVKLWDLFLDSVKKRMIGDRPIGAFLSGGVDSTSVVAAMTEISSRPVESFVISIGGRSQDVEYASIAAKHFKTNHHEINLTNIDYEKVLDELIEQYDEPFFDQSAVPSMIINKAVKKFATVILSGDGGDELFGGYENYPFSNFLSHYSKLPKYLKKFIEAGSHISSKRLYQAEIMNQDFFTAYADFFSLWKTNLPKSHYYVTKTDLYNTEFSRNLDPKEASNMMKAWFGSDVEDVANAAMRADINGRLPDGYLAKVDFASLRNAVEVRPPFLDHRLVELAQSIPSSKKIKHGKGKLIWKDVVIDKLPSSILIRPKAGFAIPLEKILLNELKSIIQKNILGESARINKYFSAATVQKIWEDHEAKKADYSNHLWSLLIFELWLRKYLEN